jgi:hypothetical protein
MKEQNLALLASEVGKSRRQLSSLSLSVEPIERNIFLGGYRISTRAGIRPEHSALPAPLMPNEVRGNPVKPWPDGAARIQSLPTPKRNRERLSRQIISGRDT